MGIILASASPRRQELLRLFGFPFTVRSANIDETMDLSKPPQDEVARVSRCKALAVSREPEDLVIGADTVVVCQGRVLGKPHSEAEALAMLKLLRPGSSGDDRLHGDTGRKSPQLHRNYRSSLPASQR